MAEKRRPTINSILKDPAASDWLKAAVRSALEWGARTDLVFNEPLERSFEQRGVEGLVLTEWKTANAKNGLERFEEGRTQAKLYKDGPLVASELTGYRYVIAVSLEDLPHGNVPDDLIVEGVVYRHINIAIEPKPPSVRARE